MKGDRMDHSKPAGVNHIGIRFKTVEELERVVAILVKLYWHGYKSPEPSHQARWYFQIPNPTGEPSGLWLELQVLAEPIASVHIEVDGGNNPGGLLQTLVGSAHIIPFGTEAPWGMGTTDTILNFHSSETAYITRQPGV